MRRQSSGRVPHFYSLAQLCSSGHMHAFRAPISVVLALRLTRITLVCIGKSGVCECVFVDACVPVFARCITSCVSLTGPVPRWPPCHATLLPLRPTGSDTCEMLTWSVAAPSRASGCCSFSHSSPLLPRSMAVFLFIYIYIYFFYIFQKGLKRFHAAFSPLPFSPNLEND